MKTLRQFIEELKAAGDDYLDLPVRFKLFIEETKGDAELEVFGYDDLDGTTVVDLQLKGAD